MFHPVSGMLCQKTALALLLCLLVCSCAAETLKLKETPVDAAAMYGLGIDYGTGNESKSIPHDPQKALYWLQRSAGEGSLPAMHALGWVYFEGRGVPKDLPLAASHFRHAAELGYAESQYMLGLFYVQGWGVEKDSGLSLQWIKRAADQGHLASQNLLRNLFGGAVQPPS